MEKLIITITYTDPDVIKHCEEKEDAEIITEIRNNASAWLTVADKIEVKKE